MTYGGINDYMDAAAEIGRNLVSKHHIDDSAWVWRMSRLTRDGTTEPVSRDQRGGEQGGRVSRISVCRHGAGDAYIPRFAAALTSSATTPRPAPA